MNIYYNIRKRENVKKETKIALNPTTLNIFALNILVYFTPFFFLSS